MTEFHYQGPVPSGSAAYVERQFENRALTQLLAGRWILLLGPRQHGKSTGIIRLKRKLSEAGLLALSVDLQSQPPCAAYEQLLAWFASKLAKQQGMAECAAPLGSDAGEFACWLRLALPEDSVPIVIFIDEASAIPNDEWRNHFYGQIRSMTFDRAEANPEDLLHRLRFVFCGTFKPETLVESQNSPFNVCENVITEDLDLESVRLLWRQVTGEPDSTLLDAAYSLVGGQPYLIQSVLARVGAAEVESRDEAYAEAIHRLRTGADGHFDGLFGRVIADPVLADVVARVVANGSVPNEPANPDFKFLQVIGLLRREDERLVFRNEIYANIAATMLPPNAETAANLPIVQLPSLEEDQLEFVTNGQLKEIAFAAGLGAIRCYNAGSFRLALAGFGCATEALLIDWLTSFEAADLAAAVSAAGANWRSYETQADPKTWRLVNLLKVARVAPTSIGQVDAPEALREWRNLIHPGVALGAYVPEAELEPEARAASGLYLVVVREIARHAANP